ncbi:MAG TPA: response regulator [Chitinophagaceae bacterium]|nr:response regulator [Chitinophagaceae bacterium]
MKTETTLPSLASCEFQLQELVNDVVSGYRTAAYERHINLQVIDDFAAPVTLAGERTALHNILNALLQPIFRIANEKVTLGTKQLVQTEKELLLEFNLNTDGLLTNNYVNWSADFDGPKALIEAAGGKSELYSGTTVGTTFKFIIKYGWRPAQAKPAPVFAIHANPLAGKKILVAEDNEINQKVITHLLKRHQIEVDIANDGKEAVELFEENGVYDLVIMDLHMPRMNGFQAANYLRKILMSSVPIIALTASAYANEQVHCFEVGMNQYISKPFQAEELLRHLRYFLLADHEFSHTPQAARAIHAPVYSLDYLEGANDPQYLCEVLELFIVTTPGLLDEIESLVRSASYNPAIEKTAKLKGSFTSLNMRELLPLVNEMDAHVRKGSKPEVILELLERLQVKCEGVYPILSEDLKKMKLVRV